MVFTSARPAPSSNLEQYKTELSGLRVGIIEVYR